MLDVRGRRTSLSSNPYNPYKGTTRNSSYDFPYDDMGYDD
jgi:hypothetical protein